jgi:hypothetical protein
MYTRTCPRPRWLIADAADHSAFDSEFGPHFAAVAKSWTKVEPEYRDQHFWGVLDFADAVEVFRRVRLSITFCPTPTDNTLSFNWCRLLSSTTILPQKALVDQRVARLTPIIMTLTLCECSPSP